MDAMLIVAALAAQIAPAANTNGPAPSEKAPEVKGSEETYLDIEGAAGYSSNPQLSIFDNEGSAFGRISLHGVHSHVSDRSSTVLSAYADNISYTNHHGSQQSASLLARHDASVSEHARLFVDATASYQENGQLDTRVLGIPVVAPPTPGGPVTPPILVLPSGDFLSVRGRELSLAAHGGGTFSLSPIDSFSVSSGVEHVTFKGFGTSSNYTSIPASVSYDRTLSERTSVGARVSGLFTDYEGPGSVRTVTPQLTGRVRLSQAISLDGAVGASFARVDDGLTVRHTTGVSAQVDLCGQGENNSYCARFVTDEQSPTTAGPARSIGGSIDYSQRLGANQSIQFALGVTRYSSPISLLTAHTFSDSTYYHAAASYSHGFGARFFGGVNLAARKLTQNGPDPNTDFSASLFVRYRFGDVQ